MTPPTRATHDSSGPPDARGTADRAGISAGDAPATAGAGPYGTRSACSSPGAPCRQRRDMTIGTPIEIAVKIAYRARITPRVTVTPLAGVTALLTSSTR
jgi:hypothetical protein